MDLSEAGTLPLKRPKTSSSPTSSHVSWDANISR
jgi:hypothetical protein